MKKHLALIVCVGFLAMIFLSGCEAPPPDPPPKPKVVRKKIGKIPAELLKKKDVPEEITSRQEESPSGNEKEPDEVILAKTSEEEKIGQAEKLKDKKTQEEEDVPASELPDGNKQVGASESNVKEDEKRQPDKTDIPGDEKTIVADAALQNKDSEGKQPKKEGSLEGTTIPIVFPDEKNNSLLASNVAGRVDPFVPLFRDKPREKKKKKKDKKIDKPKRRLTPLEKLDLGQLKLVGIVWAENGNKALVEESSGKGYIITKGTYIGIHSGRVVDILKNKIVVEEKDEDEDGNPIVHKRELKFKRPDGDDYYEM